jgi:glycine cleavage system H lipoate-binding protein
MNDSLDKTSKDSRCVWMTAGIINYKLCNCDFACEDCQFDKVMRGIIPFQSRKSIKTYKSSTLKNYENIDFRIKTWIVTYLNSLFSDCTIHLDRYYHPSQLWSKIDGEAILIGLNKLVCKILEPIEKILPPQKGKVYQEDQLIAYIIRKDQSFPLHSPHSGTVSEINPILSTKNFTKIIEEDSYLFKMTTPNITKKDSDDLYGLKHFMKVIELLKNNLVEAFKKRDSSELGITCSDGGMIQYNLEKVIGKSAFNALINNLFLKNKREKKNPVSSH